MRNRPFAFRLLLAIAIPMAGQSPAQNTRYHEYTGKFSDPEDGVNVLSAGFFGAKGSEWLSAGGFAPDGSIVMAGNVIGPDFMPCEVVGQDATKPPEATRQPELDSKAGRKPKGTARLS